MRISGWGIWAQGTGCVFFLSPVLGALVGGALAFGMEAPYDDLFMADGRFVVGNAVVGGVIGAFAGMFALIPAGVVWTGIFAWAMVRQGRAGGPTTRSIRRQAVLIAGSVQLVAVILFVREIGSPGGDPRGSLRITGLSLWLLTLGVAAILGPWLVKQAEGRAARS